mgnify:CR=1 FL=1
MKLPDKVYDVLKWICLIALPALGSLYFGLSKIWGFPYGVEVVGTLDLIAAFIGALIGVSTISYRKEADNDKP